MIKSCILSCLLLGIACGIQFKVTINHYSRMCFNEFITQSTPFRFKAIANDANYELSMLFHDGSILIKKPQNNAVEKKIDSYSAVSAQYSFCLENLAAKQDFSIQFLQGIELSDTNALPSMEDHKMLDNTVDRLNQEYMKVKEQEHYSITVNQFNMQLQKLVSFKAVGFGFLSITVVLIISFLHYLEIKRVLRNRKII